MRFSGAFVLPDWVMGLAEHVRPVMLVRHAQSETGVVAHEPNAGAHALAAWIVADPDRAKRHADKADGILFMGDLTLRMLAGEVLPSPMQTASIEEATGGAVKWDLWNLPYQGAGAGDFMVAAPEAAPAPEPEPDPEPEPVLGETASGPLWRAKRNGKRTLVSGAQGVNLTLTHASGEQLWRELSAIYSPQGGTPPGIPAHS
jgi:hypothetical protein